MPCTSTLKPPLPLSFLAVFLALAGTLLFASQTAQAQTQTSNADTQTLTVATREAPPFAMKDGDGQWSGLAIDMWRQIADERGLSYKLVETDLGDMVDGVADGRYDASVGALTVTAAREEKVDFTHPFYATGFGIAVAKADPTWLILLRNFFTWQFLQAILALCAVLLVVGALFWLVERKHNADEFSHGARGLFAGFWFSAVTMTTVGYGDKAPKTAAGKAIALVWMFAAILIISTFTGMIASSLTSSRLSGAIAGPENLPSVTVGSIPRSATDEWLTSEGIGFTGFADIESGLKALREGRIDAFVYDEPLLRYQVRKDPSNELRMLAGTFGRQDYAIATGPGSALREPIDISLLEIVETTQWRDDLRRVLGKVK